MHQESEQHQRLVTNAVNKDAADDDRNAKASQASTGNNPQISFGKSKIVAPFREHFSANRKAHAGCNQCEKTGPKQLPAVIHIDTFRWLRQC